MVTADELEWPTAVGRTIKELAMDSGKSEMTIYTKMRSQKKGLNIRGYKVEVVEVEEWKQTLKLPLKIIRNECLMQIPLNLEMMVFADYVLMKKIKVDLLLVYQWVKLNIWYL